MVDKEKIWIFVLILILGFLALTFNPTLAFIYGLFLLGAYIIIDTLGLNYKINNITKNTPKQLLIASIGIIIFLAISFVLDVVLQKSALLKGNFFVEYLKIFAVETPLLAGNKLITMGTFSVIIPIIETLFFFGVLLTVILKLSGVSFQKINLNSIIVILLVSSIFTFFHLQVRGLADNVGLMGYFIFAIISSVMVMKTKEIESAMWFHIMWNLMVVWQKLIGDIPFLRF